MNNYRYKRVYVDTSVIGGCFDSEFSLWSNSLITDFRNKRLIPLLSEIVATEVQEAPKQVREMYDELFFYSEFIAVNINSIELADAYQGRKILTPKFYEDGLHIALATIAEADVLVSWNFKHIVHFERIRLFKKIRLFNVVNLEHGYKPLQIFSPREVMSYGDTDD
ncbi:MAG: hypothetical protein R3E08_09220 [Thiotrichaceae bacterium]